jgi:hypothetical protein
MRGNVSLYLLFEGLVGESESWVESGIRRNIHEYQMYEERTEIMFAKAKAKLEIPLG